MYKVFFKDRTVFFRNDLTETFLNHSGLFYKFGSKHELKALINVFYDLNEIRKLYLVHENPELIWNEFRGCFTHIEAAGGLVMNPDNQILVIFRNGIWDLPKGKADAGESMEETALREVAEECGIYPLSLGQKIIETYHTYRIGNENILKRTHWYDMKYKGGKNPEPEKEENISEIRWVNPADMGFVLQNTFPSILEVFRAKGLQWKDN